MILKMRTTTGWCGARIAHKAHTWTTIGPWTGVVQSQVQCEGVTRRQAAEHLAAWQANDPRKDVVR